MPKRLNANDVKNEFIKFGYVLPNNFNYTNAKQKFRVYDERNEEYVNLSYQQLKYQTQNAATIRQPYFDKSLMNIPLNENANVSLSSFERFVNNQNGEFQNETEEYQQKAFETFNKTIPIIKRKQNTTVTFDEDEKLAQIFGFLKSIEAADLINTDLRLTIKSNDGRIQYAHANKNTIGLLINAFVDNDVDMKDSDTNILDTFVDVESVDLEFIPSIGGSRRNAGYFPFINKSNIDLSEFGIYSNESEIKNESCLITACRSSKLFDEEQMKMIESVIKTRNVLKSDLKHLAKLFDIHIHVSIITDYETGKTSHDEYNKGKEKRLKLLIAYNHYLINKTVLTPYSKRPMSIYKIIKKLIDERLMEPLSERKQNELIKTYSSSTNNDFICENSFRRIKVEDKKMNKYVRENRINPTKKLFGYEPEPEEVNERLNELQQAINKLPLRHWIDVKKYYKFSELGQKILYETGCFENVYEFCGKIAKDIRGRLHFPKTKTLNNKPFYSNEKLYYLDVNGAYMNFVKYIETGEPNEKGEFEGKNERIGEVIKMMYDLRLNAKHEGKNKLATTLKFIMNSVWGFSISKPKVIKYKYVQKVDNYIERFGSYVLKYNYTNGESGFVNTVNCYVENFTFPQFAYSVLTEYNKFFDYVKSLVPVYYENIDAILTNEEGFNKLKSLNLIDNEELGKFKLDKVFKEIAIKSNRLYVAKTINDEVVFHTYKKQVDYETFVNEVINSL